MIAVRKTQRRSNQVVNVCIFVFLLGLMAFFCFLGFDFAQHQNTFIPMVLSTVAGLMCFAGAMWMSLVIGDW